MALKRTPDAEPAATLRMVASTERFARLSSWTGRTGALVARARPELLPRGGRLLSYAAFGALAGILLLVATATVPVFFGYHTYIVYGQSMGGGLRQGSVAVAHPVDAASLDVGDVIALKRPPRNRAVLHRIISIDMESGQRVAITQGDANEAPDPEPVLLTDEGDKVVYHVPLAGYLLHYAGGRLGPLLLIGAPLGILAIIYLREAWRSLRRQGGSGTGAGDGTTAPPRGSSRPATTDEEWPEAAAILLDSPPSLEGGQRPAIQHQTGWPVQRYRSEAALVRRPSPAHAVGHRCEFGASGA